MDMAPQIRLTGRAAAAGLLVAVTGGCGLVTVPAATSTATAPPSLDGTATAPPSVTATPPQAAPLPQEQAYMRVIAKVLPSIVQITTSKGLGSGIVYDSQGHILTNAHVVGQAKEFKVTLPSGGLAREARLVASYPLGDLAVIRVKDTGGLTPATFGDSTRLRVGQLVLAMGNPLGLSGSVTDGIISALGRTVTEPQGAGSPGATITSAIQTSAAINPGNSGGALTDMAGQVIGLPTLAAIVPELEGTAPGIGFAIPSSTAKDIADQIIRHGKVVNTHRAALGVRVNTVIGPSGQPAGVGVAQVEPGGGAAKAGIRPGDVITKINGTPTPTAAALTEILATLRPGTQVQVELIHPNGTTRTLTVTLGTLPSR
ncbi:trypsin-like peptidase domain-containing protein [Sphaerisporangium rubeum]